MKNEIIKRIMYYRLDMDTLHETEEITEAYKYLETLPNRALLAILIEWKHNR